MPVPSDQDQVRFLLNVQRLLGEGQFTATYKYALLLALADLAVECGTDTGDSLTVGSLQIAEKFVDYYWRQVVPYPAGGEQGEGLLLRQNTDRQAAVIRLVDRARVDYGDSLPAFRSQKAQWQRLVREVARVVRVMPLWKLQVVGRTVFDFLYENAGSGTTITLRPGVAFCLSHFHGMITELVRSGWVRYIRQQNLGQTCTSSCSGRSAPCSARSGTYCGQLMGTSVSTVTAQSSDRRMWTTSFRGTRWRKGSGIGKSCGKSAGRLAAPATILKGSLKGTGSPGMGCHAGDSASFSGSHGKEDRSLG